MELPMDRHERYVQQASWTRSLRRYLFDKIGIRHAQRVLEVGCGTGAILEDLQPQSGNPSDGRAQLFGVDIDAAVLAECRAHARLATLTTGDALALPYATGAFHVTYCHFLLLWTRSPSRAVAEMRRVTNRGGHVLALAEPDYTQRIDEPPELASLGNLQTESLARQGADTSMGSRVADLFRQAGLKIREAGCLSPAVESSGQPNELEAEWEILESDLKQLVPEPTLARARHIDRLARLEGHRRLYVPTYFVWGQV
jgi:SAM-dependent methyltransferase